MAVCLLIYNPIMEDKIREYLKQPALQPRPPGDQDPLFQFLIAYIGQLFVQGYRIIQNYGDILLLSLMEFQFSEGSNKAPRHLRKLQPRFKLVLWQMTSKDLFQNGKTRRQLFTRMLEIGKLVQEVEYHIIYLKEVRYSIIPEVRLEKNALPNCLQYFLKIQWIEQKNGCRPIMEKDEGIEMHRLVESFIKGAGEGRNPDLIRRIQGQNKFVYDLFKVINTVCYIIGKEILQNDFQTMSVQKWMRKFTQKKFKRYDLLMRGENKCSIIDWKFTRLDAQDKIRGAGTQRKNQAYYQLAKKDFKTDVQLKFYCFHQRAVNLSYHSFSSAKFNYKISTVNIDDQDRRGRAEENNESDFRFGQISIEDSVVDLVPDTPGDEIVVRQRPVISVESDGEICADQRSSSNSSLNYRNSSVIINRAPPVINQQQPVQNKKNILSIAEEIVLTNKQKLKAQKRLKKQKENLIAASGKAFEIDSD